MVLVLVLAIACLTVAALLVGEVVAAPSQERMRSIRLAAGYGRRLYADTLTRQSFRERVVQPLRQRLAGLVLRLSPRTTLESVALRLVRAGLTRRVTPIGFLASKAVGVLAGLGAGAALGAVGSGGATSVVLTVACAACGYLLPDAVLTLRTRSRREQIDRALPNALDLLAVSVEAGLGFDAAVTKLSERISGPLADEFKLVLHEVRLGESRENGLKRLAERTGSSEVAAFVRGMIQADQLGMSIGRILRVQASDARSKRQAAAEERAMKAPVKMLLPTVVFIFPAMFLVILGPAFIGLFELF